MRIVDVSPTVSIAPEACAGVQIESSPASYNINGPLGFWSGLEFRVVVLMKMGPPVEVAHWRKLYSQNFSDPEAYADALRRQQEEARRLRQDIVAALEMYA